MSEQKKQQILETAISEFAEKGFFKTKTAEIAANAGVSKGLVFHNFESKKNLYAEAVSTAIERLHKAFDYESLPQTSLSALFSQSLIQKFELTDKHSQEIQLVTDAYVNIGQFPAELAVLVNRYMEESKSKSYDLVATIIKKMRLRKTVNEDDVIRLVIMTFNQIEQEARGTAANQRVSDLHFFDELIERAEAYMAILEQGFLE